MTGTTACHYTSDKPAPIVTGLCNTNIVRLKILTAVTIKVCPQFSWASRCPIRYSSTNVWAKLAVPNLR
jgi:hypothetical protein